MRVFISGATGFVGSNLINFLNSPGSTYTIYGTSFPQKSAPGEKNIFFMDIRSEEDVFRVIKEIKPLWIFHLAAISNVKYSWGNKKETLETNVLGTFYLFEAVREFSPQSRFLFVSSSDVYGAGCPDEEALEEKDSFNVVNPYAFSKVSGELLSKFYIQSEGLDIVIVRPFTHTGPGQSPDFVCSDWARQIAQIEKGLAKPVIKVGNLEAERDYTSVSDVVRAYTLLMQKGKRGEVYNVCSGKFLSLKKILDILLSFSSLSIEVQVDPEKLRKADIPRLVGSNIKIYKDTSWRPEIPLEKSLFDLLEYWRQR
ncbi:MAG: GDP-mannose 4,6-dehydratase [Candidatus Aminicenantaceae bacterium]